MVVGPGVASESESSVSSMDAAGAMAASDHHADNIPEPGRGRAHAREDKACHYCDLDGSTNAAECPCLSRCMQTDRVAAIELEMQEDL